jgi:hypothetical protein
MGSWLGCRRHHCCRRCRCGWLTGQPPWCHAAPQVLQSALHSGMVPAAACQALDRLPWPPRALLQVAQPLDGHDRQL